MIDLVAVKGVDINAIKVLHSSFEEDGNAEGLIFRGSKCVAVVHNTSESFLPIPILGAPLGTYTLLSYDSVVSGEMTEEEYDKGLTDALPNEIWDTTWWEEVPLIEKVEALGLSCIGGSIGSLIQQACAGHNECILRAATEYAFCEDPESSAGDVPLEAIAKLLPLMASSEKSRLLIENIGLLTETWNEQHQ